MMQEQPTQPITDDDFQPQELTLAESEKIASKSLSFWEDAWIRFRKNKLAFAGIIILILLGLLAAFGPLLSGYSYHAQSLIDVNKPPSGKHWFGTDALGRDMFSRTWYGARISLFIGIVAAGLDILIGIIWGAVAGFVGGKVDEIMMRIADILYGIPYLLIVILLMVVLPQGLWTIIIAMTVAGWINMARIVRGQVLRLKQSEYVLASRALGSKTTRLLFKHLIPNTLGEVLVTLTLTIPTAIFGEAFLSYLGLGVPDPKASWGTMSAEGVQSYQYYPWELLFPAFFICLTMVAFNVIGDGLRDSLDPKGRK